MIVLGFSGIDNGALYRERYGLRFVGHDSSAALVRDGRLLFAVEEERLTRVKHTSALPVQAIEAALRATGVRFEDIDCLAYPWNATLARVAHMFRRHPLRIPPRHWHTLAVAGARVLRDLMSPTHARRRLRVALGRDVPPVRGVSHHLGHSACAYFTSPFEHAAVLTIDGQGEDESASLGEWNDGAYRHFQSIQSPDSIGILYGMVTDFLGMRAAWDEYKVMGMAAHGDPRRFAHAFTQLVRLLPDGRYTTHRTALVFAPGYCDAMLAEALGVSKRRADEELGPLHFDIAAALQQTTESVVFHLLRRLRELSQARDLCLAGGVFLNSVVNGKILASELFERVHVPPVPGDHGGALGAALYVANDLGDRVPAAARFSAFCGPEFSRTDIERALASTPFSVIEPASIVEDVADRLAHGQILGWFQGRAEYGPRALGHRSILASPADASMRDTVNARIKHREPFRPFGAAVTLEDAPRLFALRGASPYMQSVVPIVPTFASQLAAVAHFGTCRVQTVSKDDDPLFHALLVRFGQITGVPALLNTSFNDRDEPIVCSPEDAMRTFARMDLDALAIGPFVVTKR